MVTLVGMLSPIPKPSVKQCRAFSGTTRTKLDRLLARMTELVAPLSAVSTRGELTKVLERGAAEYLHQRNEIGRSVMDELAEEDFQRFVSEAYEDMLALVRGDVEVLGPGDGDLLADVLESNREMVAGLVEGFKVNTGATLDLVVESSPALLRLDMCVSAILLVLAGEVTRWNPASIRLLSQMAHELMGEVEDIFLAHDPELAQRLTNREPTVSLQEVRKKVGLSS